MPTEIIWTQETWNPVVGCTRISEACRNCYAEKMAGRQAAMHRPQYQEVVEPVEGHYGPDCNWNGRTAFVEKVIDKPKTRRKPTVYFVVSMGDLFHETAPYAWIARVLETCVACPQHIFLLLTKRSSRMNEVLGEWLADTNRAELPQNIHCGVTVENQKAAEERMPHLLASPAAVRFVSAEPLLGPIDFRPWFNIAAPDHLQQMIVAGESGPGARLMNKEWVVDIRDQCRDSGVLFCFKQWGGVNKKQAGRVLDGQTYDDLVWMQLH